MISNHTIASEFEELYGQAREKEHRICSDEELFLLPHTTLTNPHHDEWQLRKKSAGRLVHQIEKKQKPLSILEVGCGNGWLSHRLSLIQGISVTGLDIHFSEIQQATRVFSAIPNLSFHYGSLDDAFLTYRTYDFIVFAASIQYFKSLPAVLDRSMLLLNDGGDIHILDSPFYERQQLEGARQRTKQYYEELGFPGMTSFYFHHCVDELTPYPYKSMNKLNVFEGLFLDQRNPFPWYCINKMK